MISSPQEFLALLDSADSPDAQRRLRNDEAPDSVWLSLLQCDVVVRRAIAFNRTLSVSVLRALAADSDAAVRVTIASRRKLPVDLFEVLARDVNESVRIRVAWNRRTPSQVLDQLSRDACELVSEPARSQLSSRDR